MRFTCNNGILTPYDAEAEKLCTAQDGKTLDMKRITKVKRRSLEANSKYHAWNAQIEREHGYDPGYAHRLNKYMFGVAILRERFPEQVGHVRKMMIGMAYETRLDMMEIMPCSSLFIVSEMTRYMDAIQRHWAGEGIQLS